MTAPNGNVLAVDDYAPTIDTEAFVAVTATIVGRVTIGARSSVWYGAVVRADQEAVALGEDCNVQDGCILHADPGEPVRLGDRVSLGHGAILHSAVVEDDVLIGMRAVVLNGARIGTGSVVAAGTVVLSGTDVPPRSLVAGVPGKVRRDAGPAEATMVSSTAEEYVELAQRHRGVTRVGSSP